MNRPPVVGDTTTYTIARTVLLKLPRTIRTIRQVRGISQEDAAKEIGVALSTLRRLESTTGSTNARLGTLVKALLWVDDHQKGHA